MPPSNGAPVCSPARRLAGVDGDAAGSEDALALLARVRVLRLSVGGDAEVKQTHHATMVAVCREREDPRVDLLHIVNRLDLQLVALLDLQGPRARSARTVGLKAEVEPGSVSLLLPTGFVGSVPYFATDVHTYLPLWYSDALIAPTC